MNDCFEKVRLIQRYYNRTVSSQLTLLLNFYVKMTVRREDFGAKFNIIYHNGAPVADIFKRIEVVCYWAWLVILRSQYK